MDIVIYISIAYLVLTSAVLIWNFQGLLALDSITEKSSTNNSPLVSICIPARNEEKVIDRCISSVLKQNYPNFEVLILDDHSTDETSKILEEFSDIIANVHHLKGKAKPDDWLGKNWACHQLSEAAKGDYLIFIDADVWLEESAISKTVQALQKVDAITVWPKQVFGSFWEKAIIPLVYHVLYTLLPSRFVEKEPDWIRRFTAKWPSLNFAAACGQFMAFNISSYKKIGGHESVKGEVVEDVALARQLKRHEQKLKMYHGVGTVSCRMYQNHHELWQGFRKNFFAGFDYKVLPFVLMAVLYLMVFIFPFIILAYSFFEANQLTWSSLFAISLIFVQRFILDLRFGWNFVYSLLHPIGVLWFQLLALRSLWDYFSGNKASWKGRKL